MTDRNSSPFYHRINWNGGDVSHVFCIFGLTVCFGWLGNCGVQPLLRFDKIRLKGHALGFKIIWDPGHLQTRIHIRSWRNPRTWGWNSEWIAYRFGEYHDDEYGRNPDYYHYTGILGNHMYV